LVTGGLRVQVYDFDPNTVTYFVVEAGGEVAASPRLMAEACDIVVAMLPRAEEVREVALGREGVVHGFEDGGVFVDMSASPPEQTRSIAKELAAAGIAMLDAPVIGGAAEARTGNLAILVGGEADAVARCAPALERLGSRIIRTGPLGSAHAAKAVCGLLSASTLLATGEAMLVGTRYGLDPARLLDAVNASPGASPTTLTMIERQVLSRGFNSGLGLDGILGDLDHALEIARSSETPAPFAALCREIWASARLHLGPGQDYTRLVRWMEEALRTELCRKDR
jgi:3-hydroxyisobutyrate dehydrogenase